MAKDNLPPQTKPLIGREKELADVISRLVDPDCRLLTIVGPGGIGKSHLTLAAAAQVIEAFDDGVRFVDLQPVAAADFLSAVTDVLPFARSGSEALQTQLLNYLQGKQLLFVLDNFEHLLSQAVFLSELLRDVPGFSLLVASREALNLQNEWLYPLRGLSVPPHSDGVDVTEYDAVKLFFQCARHVRPGFLLDEELHDVTHICRLVDGMPLALELAASWTKVLTCAEIAAEIQHNLAFLTTNLRDVPERHRSMEAVFKQSWQLLTEEEQQVFMRLSIFHGSFDRQAARVVANASLPVLSSLMDKCMLRREENGRYTIHELLRQYGFTKLRQNPDTARRVRKRHVSYYVDFLHQRVAAINGVNQRQASAEIGAELENVRAAWQWAVDKADVETIRRAASPFFFFCQMQSRFLEGAESLAKAVTTLEQLPPGKERDNALATVYNHEGWLRIRVGKFRRAKRILKQSRELFARHDEPPLPYMGCDSAVPLGLVRVIEGDYRQAVELGEEARQAAAARDDVMNLSFAHYLLTTAKTAQGQYEAAYRHAQRACSLARQAGNHWFLAYPLNEWGNVARAMGDYAGAKKHFQASYHIKETFGDAEGMAVALNHLGEIALWQAKDAEAEKLFQDSLAIYRDMNDRGGRATSLKGLGQVAYAREAYEKARKQLGQALDIAAEIQFRPLIFALLVDGGKLLLQSGEQSFGLSLLFLVRRHPASDQETKEQANRALGDWQEGVDEALWRQAMNRSEALDLKTAVATLQTILTAPIPVQKPDLHQEQPLIEPLTDRELEVLRLMAQGQTNPEIAAELIIALGTVKWYASQIYGKLGVSNRTEAAVRARELGLLS